MVLMPGAFHKAGDTMAQNSAGEIVKKHSDGSRAVSVVQAADALFYDACGPDGLSVGVYDTQEQATSAANWAWDFLTERADLPRVTLMQLIVDKLRQQYPDDSAEVALGPTGE